MYFIKLKYKQENFKINNNFIIKEKFLNLTKNIIKSNKHVNIIIKLNGCKGYIYNFYISKIIKKNSVLLNFKNLNLYFKYSNIFYLINSKINILKKKKKIYILVFLKNSIICKCGLSFYIK